MQAPCDIQRGAGPHPRRILPGICIWRARKAVKGFHPQGVGGGSCALLLGHACPRKRAPNSQMEHNHGSQCWLPANGGAPAQHIPSLRRRSTSATSRAPSRACCSGNTLGRGRCTNDVLADAVVATTPVCGRPSCRALHGRADTSSAIASCRSFVNVPQCPPHPRAPMPAPAGPSRCFAATLSTTWTCGWCGPVTSGQASKRSHWRSCRKAEVGAHVHGCTIAKYLEGRLHVQLRARRFCLTQAALGELRR